MDQISVKEISELVNSGGNIALILCAWFIHRAEVRLKLCEMLLTTIRDALEKFPHKQER